MVLSSLAAARVCGMALCGGCESGSAIGAGAKRRLAREAVWRCGGGWALKRNTAEPVRAEQWSGGDQTRRVDRRPHGPEPGRLMTTLDRGMPWMAEGLALTLRRRVWLACPDTRCASSPQGCIPAARNTSDGVFPGRGVEE